jgi:hypothetical protein
VEPRDEVIVCCSLRHACSAGVPACGYWRRLAATGHRDGARTRSRGRLRYNGTPMAVVSLIHTLVATTNRCSIAANRKIVDPLPNALKSAFDVVSPLNPAAKAWSIIDINRKRWQAANSALAHYVHRDYQSSGGRPRLPYRAASRRPDRRCMFPRLSPGKMPGSTAGVDARRYFVRSRDIRLQRTAHRKSGTGTVPEPAAGTAALPSLRYRRCARIV